MNACLPPDDTVPKQAYGNKIASSPRYRMPVTKHNSNAQSLNYKFT